MINLNRAELKLILAGLHREREALREELLADESVGNIMDVEEYNNLVRLQDKIIDTLEARFY